jgi:phospholipase C
MRSRGSIARVTGFCVAVLSLAACNGNGSTAGTPPVGTPFSHGRHHSGSSSPIQHIVLMIQENRSYNNFFATFPGGDGTTTGYAETDTSCKPPIYAGPIDLTEMPLDLKKDLNHSFRTGYSTAYDGGKMDGFDLVPNGSGLPECSYPYQYTNPSDIQPYWTMASEYALAEHMFTTQGSDSFTAHQDLIRGGTIVGDDEAMVDLPRCSSNCYWGCNAPHGTITHLINSENEPLTAPGPYPCSKDFSYKSKYETLRDLLDAKKISWKYYVPPNSQVNGKL